MAGRSFSSPLPPVLVVSAPAQCLGKLPRHWEVEGSNWELEQKLVICHS